MSSKKKKASKRPLEPTRRQILAALKKESELEMTTELIRRRLAMPIEQRMNFLRVRLPGGGSAL